MTPFRRKPAIWIGLLFLIVGVVAVTVFRNRAPEAATDDAKGTASTSWQNIPFPTAAPPPESVVQDESPMPSAGGRIDVAFVVQGDHREPGYGSYAVDVGEEHCDAAPHRAWLEEGKTVWLYGDAGLGKGRVGQLRKYDRNEYGVEMCTAFNDLVGVKSRRSFLVAAPHGHGLSPVKKRIDFDKPDQVSGIPDSVASLVREFWSRNDEQYASRFPLSEHDQKYGNFKGTRVRISSKAASLFLLEDSRILVSFLSNGGRYDDSADFPEGASVYLTSLELALYDPATKAISPIDNQCGDGNVLGVFDLNRDGKLELAIDVTGYEMPFHGTYCEYDGSRLVKVL